MTDLAPIASTGSLEHWHATTGLPVMCTPTGLALPDDLTIEEWRALAPPLFGAARASMWWVGDWVTAGERFDSYAEAALELGLGKGTLKNAASVCRRLPPSRRRDDLPFWLHAEIIGALEPDEWDDWIRRAATERWTMAQLRAAIRDSKALPAGSSEGAPTPAVAPRLSRFALREDHAPVVLRVVEWAERVLRDHLSADEAEVLGELLEALRKAAA